MSTLPRDIMLRVQNDSYQRLLIAAYLADVAVIKLERQIVSSEIEQRLQTLKGRSGKVGACILVQRPILSPESDNVAARSQIIQAFTALEHPTINAQSNGTKKTAQEIAVEIFNLFHMAAASLPGQVFSGYPGGAIVPDNGFEALNGWEVRMQMFAALGRADRVGTPLIDPDAGAAPQLVTLTCGTAGASIYYTTDGSAPTSGNATATHYTVPFTVAAAGTLRVAAEKTGLQPSSVTEATFS